MVLPVIHSNGTAATTLIDDRSDCLEAFRELANHLNRLAPNGRDYYPIPGRMELATAQHVRRVNTLDKLMREIQDERNAICDLANL